LSSTKTILEKKEDTHNKTAMELKDLKEFHENERTALEHARKLARYIIYILRVLYYDVSFHMFVIF